jgi:vancomycin aglycone glucosyltransferase
VKVLLSTIGSRGDVQPLVALALQLRALDDEVRLCVPPDFREWIESLGFAVTPIGPELRSTGRARPPLAQPTPEERQRAVEGTIAAQFETIAPAARGADVIVGATALQIAAPSIAETLGIRYVFAAYCPAVLPAPHHAPPVLGRLGDTPAAGPQDYPALWARDAERFSATFGPALNARRTALGLSAVADLRSHIFTARPWLAADPTLAPWPGSAADASVLQTGAWLVPDARPLSPEIEAFLDAGEPPVYFGFGSIRAPEDLGQVMITAARANGRRAIVSRGWAELSLPNAAPDALLIGEANHAALFRRVAAVVHHGGAGTTTAAARAGAPQVVIPQMYDQHYWAQRVGELGLGAAHPPMPAAVTAESLAAALAAVLRPEVAARARVVRDRVRGDGAEVAARQLRAALTSEVGP